MLQDQVLPIDFGQGIDNKTDPKLVVPGKLLRLENAVFDKAKRITKRNGYDELPLTISGGGTISNPKMLETFKDELLTADGSSLYSYSPELQAWVSRGSYASAEVSSFYLGKTSGVIQRVASAAVGDIAVYVVKSAANDIGPLSAIVVDLETGTTLLQQDLTADGYGARACVLGGTTLAVAYMNAARDLALRTISVSGGAVTLSSEVTIAANYALGAFSAQANIQYLAPKAQFDFMETASGGVIAYATGPTYNGTPTGVEIKTISTAGAVVSTQTHASVGKPAGVSLCVDSSTGNIWLYFLDATTVTSMPFYCTVYNSALTPVLARTAVVSGLSNITQISASVVSASSQKVYLGTYTIQTTPEASTTVRLIKTKVVDVNSSGIAGSVTDYLLSVAPYSHAFTISGRRYMLFGFNFLKTSKAQPTLFLVDLESKAVVARILSGSYGESSYSHDIANVSFLSSTRILFAASVYTDTTNNRAAKSITVEFDSADAYRGTISGELLALNGGVVSMYDGESVSELGFNLFPEIMIAEPGMGTGVIPAGANTYYAVYQWLDAQGNIHESAPSLPYTVNVGGTTVDYVVLMISKAHITLKRGIRLAIYRVDAGGTIPKLIATTSNLENNPDQDFFTVYDTTTTTTLESQPVLYTTGGVLSNTAAPAAMILETHNNRLWAVDSEDENAIWYSKSFNQGTGLSMSAFLTVQLEPKLGKIKALAAMDDKMIPLKERGICYFSGDGANDTGTGSTFSTPQYLPADVGCNSLKSVVISPSGVIFKSPKGMYLLDRGLGLHYHDQAFDGAAVEGYRDQNITSAVTITDRNQIRFLTSSGLTLVYDYLMGQWSTFTNHEGLAADNWQGRFVYVRTDGKIYKENATSFLDHSTAYAVTAQLSWLALAGVQGFQRVRRIAMLGDFENGASAGHGVQLSAAYDFEEAFSSPVQFLFGDASEAGVLQYRERLPRQKCDSLSLLIEEVVTGAAGERVDFTNLSLEAGVKRGMNKLPASRSNG